MTDKLALYNGALRKLGQPQLVELTDEGRARRSLDSCYDEVVKRCLERAFWNFAMRFRELIASPSAGTSFGYQYVFDKPDDWLRTAGVTIDGYGRVPLLDYDDRRDFLLADFEVIYLRYVSNDQDYGLDLGRWPESFTTYVQTDLAVETCEDITSSDAKKDRLQRDLKTAFGTASNTDAMNEPVTRFAPPGRLVQSRRGFGSRYDGGPFR